MAEIEIPVYDIADVIEKFPQGVEIVEYPDLGTLKMPRTKDADELDMIYQVRTPNAAKSPPFDTIDSAELWADVYFAVGGFNEDNTGGRGVPPEVAIADREVLAAYFMTHSSIDVEHLADFFDVSRNTIYSYLSRARARGREARDEIEEFG